jgi:E3 ubiquitin-protein ligase TRAF7
MEQGNDFQQVGELISRPEIGDLQGSHSKAKTSLRTRSRIQKGYPHLLDYHADGSPQLAVEKADLLLSQILFVTPPSDSLKCPIHKGLFIDPVIANCGHTFCKPCLKSEILRGAVVICPVDSTEIDFERLIPNLALSGQLQDLLTHCKFGCKLVDGVLTVDPEGCQEVVSLSKRLEHENNCMHAPAQCPFCDASFLRRMNIEEHMRTCNHLPCPHKEAGCCFKGMKGEVEHHLVTCGYESIKGFIQKYNEQNINLKKQLKETRQENAELRETIIQLTERVQELTNLLGSKHAQYDELIRQLTEAIAINQQQISPYRNSPNRAQGIAPPAFVSAVRSPFPEDSEVHSFKCKGTFVGHEGPVWALAVNKSKQMLISGSSDETIKIWDIATYKVQHTLVGHDGIVHAVVIVGRKLISGSSDKTIKVWNMNTMKCERTVTGHTNTICKLVVEGNLLFSGSYTEIKVWNLKTFACITTLKGHNHWVRALCVSDGFLYSGCHNLIKVWDVSTFRCVQSITGHYGSIYSFVIAERNLLAGTYENAVVVFDLDTFECVRALAGHIGAVYAVCTKDRRVFSGSYDSTIKVWNLDTFKCIQTLKRHTSSVEALIYEGDALFSASSDNSIKVFR